MAAAVRWAQDAAGIDFESEPIRAEAIPTGDEGPSFVFRVYYRGSLPLGGSPRSIQVHVTVSEVLAAPAEGRPLSQPFSDSPDPGDAIIRCYSLPEILSEKTRAVCGQRRFAIARDVYDIHELIRRGANLEHALGILPIKLRAKGLAISRDLVQVFAGRRADFERDWERNLLPLVPAAGPIRFGDAWETAAAVVRAVQGIGRGA